MCYIDVEGATCSTLTRPVARKRHVCEECGHPILRGQQYIRTTGIWDGRPGSVAQHEDCRALLTSIADTHCDGVYVFGDLRECVREHYRDEPAILGRWASILRARRREALAIPTPTGDAP